MTGRQNEFYNKYKEYGFEILAIDLYRSETDSTKEYAAQKGIKYPILIATDDVLRHYGGINTTPVMFVIDKSGKIVEVFERFNKSDLYNLENKIRNLLGLGPLPLPESTKPMNLENLKMNKAPDFSLSTMDDKVITLSQFADKAVLLVFWSIEDVVSIGILPYCDEILYNKYHRRDLEVIGIQIDMEKEEKEKAFSFIKANQIKIPIAQATRQLIKEYGDINTTPLMILIDQNGFIKEIYEEFNYEIVAQMEDNLLSLLKPLPPPPGVTNLTDPELLRVKKVTEIKCARCHYLDRVLLRTKTHEEWERTVLRMREKQTDWISEGEAQEITNYLSQFYSRSQ